MVDNLGRISMGCAEAIEKANRMLGGLQGKNDVGNLGKQIEH